jgi:ATP-dependent DNA helicase RecQ
VFGPAHLVDLLLGADTEKMRRLGHDRLAVHGAGKGHDRRLWRSILRQLTALGLVTIDIAGHGAMRVTEAGARVAGGEGTVALRLDLPKPRRTTARSAVPADVDDRLLRALKACRLELARAQEVPAFVVFNDATLIDMAQKHPRDRTAFAQVQGVGKAKLERYADAFLEVLRGH